MKEETKGVIQKISLGMVLVGAIGGLATGLTGAELGAGITVAESIVTVVGGVIAYIFGKKK